ncbi:hypothetical protein [Streptomyces sp. ISL-86]|uniref:hypothetical protein n=1 Tax=Streptomyces sp. ISL-86 TaxID=2819187 RepID=UPI001BE90461|nr:hypothetical protein [Streptomyces sp. ISL-86]MBT2456919.1 hypothetical protein [Streptomyces sp. ISL-86]
MSVYQYYEFLAVDRPLSEDELAQVRALSTRAHITATSFSNEYHWGDFRGDTTKMVEQLYDAHLYYANWGSRRLVLRLPAALLPAKAATPYALEESLSVWTRSGHTLLDFQLSSEDGGEWDFESSFSLSAFVGLRAELAAGDLRGLYLAWLAALSIWEVAEDDEEEYAREAEPPVPAGLAELTGPQRALADFLRVDPDLLAVAAQAAAPAPQTAVDRKALAAYIRALPAKEKDALLLDAALGTAPQPGPQLLARYRAAHLPGPQRAGAERRTAAQLLDTAHLHRTERTRQESEDKAAAARARALGISRARDAHLDRLAQDTEQVWQDVDKLIAGKQPGPYDTAVTLLTDLREIHARAGTGTAFEQRAGALRETHRGKPSLMRRFDAAGLPNP